MGAHDVQASGSPRDEVDTLVRWPKPPADDPWCVDLGHAIVCMSTAELCELVERATLDCNTRVWRDGMGCWTPLGELDQSEIDGAVPPPPLAATPTTWAHEARATHGSRSEAAASRSRWPWVAALALFVVFGALSTAIFAAPEVAPAAKAPATHRR